MLKKRLILCLLLKKDIFANSRNFNLQLVGNLETIAQYLNFDAIDELVLLEVSRDKRDMQKLSENIMELTKKCFIPITVGGGVSSICDIKLLLKSGADKVVINTTAIENPGFITEASKIFGSQCIVVSIDVKKNKEGKYEVYSHNGQKNTGKELIEWAKEVEKLGAGELFLTSIDKDGAGSGYDLELIKNVSEAVTIPVIASGGVGKFQHLVDGIKEGNASAVSAANLFHFIGDSLIKAKIYVQSKGLDFPHTLWNF